MSRLYNGATNKIQILSIMFRNRYTIESDGAILSIFKNQSFWNNDHILFLIHTWLQLVYVIAKS